MSPLPSAGGATVSPLPSAGEASVSPLPTAGGASMSPLPSTGGASPRPEFWPEDTRPASTAGASASSMTPLAAGVRTVVGRCGALAAGAGAAGLGGGVMTISSGCRGWATCAVRGRASGAGARASAGFGRGAAATGREREGGAAAKGCNRPDDVSATSSGGRPLRMGPRATATCSNGGLFEPRINSPGLFPGAMGKKTSADIVPSGLTART